MAYPTINLTLANDFLEKFIAAKSFDPTSAVKVDGAGVSEIDGIDFCKIAASLKKLIDEKPPKHASRAADAWFEMKAVQILHKPLAKLSLQAATDPKFWIWLTFAGCGTEFMEIVMKRFPGKKGKMPEKVNFGITTQANVFEGLYARVWWRGYRFYDSTAANPYDLAERGYIDIWRSHIIRERYSYGEHMAQAFLKYMYPAHGFVSGHDVTMMRKIPPKLKARHTSCCFESLSEEQCKNIIQEIADEVSLEMSLKPIKSSGKSLAKSVNRRRKSK